MNNIEKKLEALKAEFLGKLEALEKEAEMQKKQEEPKPWKPEVGEEYFYICDTLETRSDFNWGNSIDYKRIKAGNCFLTKERAEEVADKMRLLLRLEQLHDMLCPDYVPDWSNISEKKFCLAYLYPENFWFVDELHDTEYPTVYFDTEKNAEKALKILNKEIKNYE